MENIFYTFETQISLLLHLYVDSPLLWKLCRQLLITNRLLTQNYSVCTEHSLCQYLLQQNKNLVVHFHSPTFLWSKNLRIFLVGKQDIMDFLIFHVLQIVFPLNSSGSVQTFSHTSLCISSLLSSNSSTIISSNLFTFGLPRQSDADEQWECTAFTRSLPFKSQQCDLSS